MRDEIRGEIKELVEVQRREAVSVIREKAGQYQRQSETVSEVVRNSNQKRKWEAIR